MHPKVKRQESVSEPPREVKPTLETVQEIPIEDNVLFYQGMNRADQALHDFIVATKPRTDDLNSDEKELECSFGQKNYSNQNLGFQINSFTRPIEVSVLS